MSLNQDDQDDYKEGFVKSHLPDIMTQGHTTMLSHDPMEPNRCPKILARAEHSRYIIPTAYSFPKAVRILSILLKFCRAFRRKWDTAIITRDVPTSRFSRIF